MSTWLFLFFFPFCFLNNISIKVYTVYIGCTYWPYYGFIWYHLKEKKKRVFNFHFQFAFFDLNFISHWCCKLILIKVLEKWSSCENIFYRSVFETIRQIMFWTPFFIGLKMNNRKSKWCQTSYSRKRKLDE